MDEARLCNNIDELLVAAEVEDLETLADYFDMCDIDAEVIVEVPEDGSVEITMWEYGRGIQFVFPVSLAEIEAALVDIELECLIPDHLEYLRDVIERVEGLVVRLHLDERLDDTDLSASIGRRTTDSGLVVQELRSLDYPFKKPMDDSATVESWLQERVNPHCRGCRIEYVGNPSETLETLRRRHATPAAPCGPTGPK